MKEQKRVDSVFEETLMGFETHFDIFVDVKQHEKIFRQIQEYVMFDRENKRSDTNSIMTKTQLALRARTQVLSGDSKLEKKR